MALLLGPYRHSSIPPTLVSWGYIMHTITARHKLLDQVIISFGSITIQFLVNTMITSLQFPCSTEKPTCFLWSAPSAPCFLFPLGKGHTQHCWQQSVQTISVNMIAISVLIIYIELQNKNKVMVYNLCY